MNMWNSINRSPKPSWPSGPWFKRIKLNAALEKWIKNNLTKVKIANTQYAEKKIDAETLKKELRTADQFMTTTFRNLYKEVFWAPTDAKITLSRTNQSTSTPKLAIYRNGVDSRYETFQNNEDVLLRIREMYS